MNNLSVNLLKERILKNKFLCLFGILLLFAVFLRLWRIGSFNFWLDEILSIHMELVSPLAKQISYEPPFYYIILSIWVKFFGNGEVAVRSLSVLFDIGAIYLLYKTGRAILSQKTALLATVLYSLSSFAIWYSKEAKNYSLLVFLTLLTFFFFIQMIKEQKYSYGILCGLSMILNIYTNYLTFFLIPPYFIFILITPSVRQYLKTMLIISLLILLAFMPYITTFWNTFQQVAHSFWIPKPTPHSLLITLENFNLGYTITDNFTYHISHIFFTLPFIIGLIGLIKKKEPINYIIIEILLIPILTIYLISQYIPIYIDRRMLILLPFYYLILAYGFLSLRSAFLKTVFMVPAAILIMVSLTGLYTGKIHPDTRHHIGDYIKKPFTNVVEYVDKNFREGDIIAHTNYGTTLPFHWYGIKTKGLLGNYLRKGNRCYFLYSSLDRPKSEYFLNIIKNNKIPEITLDVSIAKDLSKLQGKGIWLLQADWSRSGKIDSESQAVKNILSANYSFITEKLIDSIEINYYRCGKN